MEQEREGDDTGRDTGPCHQASLENGSALRNGVTVTDARNFAASRRPVVNFLQNSFRLWFRTSLLFSLGFCELWRNSRGRIFSDYRLRLSAAESTDVLLRARPTRGCSECRSVFAPMLVRSDRVTPPVPCPAHGGATSSLDTVELWQPFHGVGEGEGGWREKGRGEGEGGREGRRGSVREEGRERTVGQNHPRRPEHRKAEQSNPNSTFMSWSWGCLRPSPLPNLAAAGGITRPPR